MSLSTNFLAFSMQTLGSPAASSTISSIGLPATLLLMPIDLAAKTHSGREGSTNYFLEERIANRLSVPQRTLSDHLAKMPSLAIPLNADLSKGFTVPQVAEKYGWAEPLVWSIALEGKDDLQIFKALNWGLRTWDLWSWTDCLPREIHVNDKQSVFHWGDKRFGDDWPGRIPAQMIAHIMYYFSDQGDLVLDPMADGGVVADTCLALNRKCWSFDMDDRPDTRPEIEPYFWVRKLWQLLPLGGLNKVTWHIDLWQLSQ